jgi:hypothetical protein
MRMNMEEVCKHGEFEEIMVLASIHRGLTCPEGYGKCEWNCGRRLTQHRCVECGTFLYTIEVSCGHDQFTEEGAWNLNHPTIGMTLDEARAYFLNNID